MEHPILISVYAVLLLAAVMAANKLTTLLTRIGMIFAQMVAWVWGLLLSVGGFALLLHEGPWPLTNGCSCGSIGYRLRCIQTIWGFHIAVLGAVGTMPSTMYRLRLSA